MAAKVKALQMWCKRQCEGYRDVSVTNMTSSWKSGLAFCAMLHRYRPDLIDYDSLNKEDVYENNKLAFDVAQDQLGIAALLDAEDMVAMTVPDKLCIVTYVAQYYNYFKDKDPVGGPGVKARTGVKRQPSPHSSQDPTPNLKKPTPPSNPQKQTTGTTNSTKATTETPRGPQGNAAPVRRGTYGDTCHTCNQKVYLLERHIEGSKLYHRRCYRDTQRSQRSPAGSLSRSARPPQLSAHNDHVQSQDSKVTSSYKAAAAANRNVPSDSATSVDDKRAKSSGSLLTSLYGSPKPYTSSSSSSTSVSGSGVQKTNRAPTVSAENQTGRTKPRSQPPAPVRSVASDLSSVKPYGLKTSSESTRSGAVDNHRPTKPYSSTPTAISSVSAKPQTNPSSTRPAKTSAGWRADSTVNTARHPPPSLQDRNALPSTKDSISSSWKNNDYNRPRPKYAEVDQPKKLKQTTDSEKKTTLDGEEPPGGIVSKTAQMFGPKQNKSSSGFPRKDNNATKEVKRSEPSSVTHLTFTSQPKGSRSRLEEPMDTDKKLTPNSRDNSRIHAQVGTPRDVFTSRITPAPVQQSSSRDKTQPGGTDVKTGGKNDQGVLSGLLANLSNVRKQKDGYSQESHSVGERDGVTTVSQRPWSSKSEQTDDRRDLGRLTKTDQGTVNSIIPSAAAASKSANRSILKTHPGDSHGGPGEELHGVGPRTFLHQLDGSCSPPHEELAPRPILRTRRISTEESPAWGEVIHSPPRPILKPEKQVVPRSRSSSPPKSILKPHEDWSPTSPPENEPKKSILKSRDSPESTLEWELGEHTSRPSRSILKNSQEDLGPSETQRVTSPGRSILKRSLDAEDRTHSDEGLQSPGEALTSPVRSILKNSEIQEGRRGSDPGAKVSSPKRSILKGSGSTDSDERMPSEHVQLDLPFGSTGVNPDPSAPKPILKRVDFMEDVHQPVSILKHDPSTGPGSRSRSSSPKSILHSSNPASSSAGPVAMEVDAEVHRTDQDTPSVNKEAGHAGYRSIFNPANIGERNPKNIPLIPSAYSQMKDEMPISQSSQWSPSQSKPSKDKQAPKVSEASSVLTGRPSGSKPTVQSDSPFTNTPPQQTPVSSAGSLSGVPRPSKSASTSPASAAHRKPGSASDSNVNNFSALNMRDSVVLGSNRGKQQQVWQLELDVRQGIKPADTKMAMAEKLLPFAFSDAASRSSASGQNSTWNASEVKGNETGSQLSGLSSKQAESQKPEWQLEAERRQALRNGKYDDPERKGLEPENTTQLKAVDVMHGGRMTSHGQAADNEDHLQNSRTEMSMDIENRSTGAHLGEDGKPPVVPPRSKHRYGPESPAGLPRYGGSHIVDIVNKQLGRGHDGKLSPGSDNNSDSDSPGQKRGLLSRSQAFRIADGSPGSSACSSPDIGQDDSSPAYGTVSAAPSGTRDKGHVSNGGAAAYHQGNQSEMNRNVGRAGDFIGEGARRKIVPPPRPSYSPGASPTGTNLKKVAPDVNFTFHSNDFDLVLDKLDGVPQREAPSLAALSRDHHPHHSNWIQSRPLPARPGTINLDSHTPKRRVNAEARMSTGQIMQCLEALNNELMELEDLGRPLEDKIRLVSDEDMDDNDDLMIQWFELVNRKNELVRNESDLMYRQRQQELEDLHEDLEYEMRCLMDKPDHMKTASDRVREESLLQELLLTINLRNNIVDSIEEDRIRYILEDQEIAEVLAKSHKSLPSTQKLSKKKKKKEQNAKPKKDKTSKSHKAPADGGEEDKDSNSSSSSSSSSSNGEKGSKKKNERKFFKISIGSSGS